MLDKFRRQIIIFLKEIFRLIREHRLLVGLALLMAFLVISPLLLFRLIIPSSSYQGINLANFGIDETWYLSRGRDILEGHKLGNAVLREGKEGQESHFQYIEYVLLKPVRWLGLDQPADVVELYHIYNFISVTALVLLIYAFLLQLGGERRLAILGALFVTGGYSIVYYRRLFIPEFIVYGRAISPGMHLLGFFIFLNFLVAALRRSEKKYLVGAILSGGALFYLYFFAWTFALAILGSLAVLYLFAKDYPRFNKVCLIAIASIVLGAYNLIQLVRFFQDRKS